MFLKKIKIPEIISFCCDNKDLKFGDLTIHMENESHKMHKKMDKKKNLLP